MHVFRLLAKLFYSLARIILTWTQREKMAGLAAKKAKEGFIHPAKLAPSLQR